MNDAVTQIPDVAYVREQIARNIRERDLLTRLLRLAERKADLATLDDDTTHRADGCNRQAVRHG